MCDVLEVSRSGFYAWQNRPGSKQTLANDELSKKITKIFFDSKERYGVLRVQAELAKGTDQIHCSKNRVAALMRKLGLVAKAGRKRKARSSTTDSNHSLPVAPNLIERDFSAESTNRLWVSDMTQIDTDEGWLYLAIVLDVYSRMVVGWAMDDNMKRELPIAALDMAVDDRKPKAGLIHHSDRGSQYASYDYRKRLKNIDALCSMSRKGNCWDNAMMESFFHSLKVESLNGMVFKTHEDAKAAIFEYINAFYNTIRRHSGLEYQTPADVDSQAA